VNLLPTPRSLKRRPGSFLLPPGKTTAINARQSDSAPHHPEGYELTIRRNGIQIAYREPPGLRAAHATLRQLRREYGRRLPCLHIRDWPDFRRRGVMLDVSRGRVPKLETLLDLARRLADFKINELQLYTEHTFAYHKYKSIWRGWGALTGREMRQLDARCRQLGIDLVPNQNSFGHLRYFLEHPRVKKLAEVSQPYEDGSGEFVRRPSTLAPNHPGTLPFLRVLYDEFLPNFSSPFFNVGCDETWDLGRGQSKKLCRLNGKGPVYLDFLHRVHEEVSRRGKRMMFWGDIILKYPRLIKKLPRDVMALNWGYEATHPFEREASLFAGSGIPFYVCPGTSTWMTLIGKHDNALRNLRRAAEAGRRHGAVGYLITDWGDGGHPQPLAVSWLPFLAGAALAWCQDTFRETSLVPVLSRDVFQEPGHSVAKAALALGLAHRKLKFAEPNVTPLGAVIAAPPPEARELFCRNGLKYFARIRAGDIRAAWREVRKQIAVLQRAARRRPISPAAKILIHELELAARMAGQSCQFMLWQQAVVQGKKLAARRMAQAAIAELTQLEKEFNALWPKRNKGTTAKCSRFLRWRIADYRRSLRPDGRVAAWSKRGR
jgi:hexosaminidase